MNRGGGGGVAFANRNGRSDYDDRNVDIGGYNAYNSNNNSANDPSGGYRRNQGPVYNGPSATTNGPRAGGGGSVGWGHFNESSSSGSRPRNDNSQYPDRASNLASRNIQHGSPPNSQSYDGLGRGGGEHRNTFNDSASSYRGYGNDGLGRGGGEHRNAFNDGAASYRGHGNDGPSNPSESLKAYQQSKSSDPYAVGLRSSAAFFHETYDKLERPGGFADSTAGKQYMVTFIKTYREMATQTTEDQVVGYQDTTWNGVRIISSSKQQPQPHHPQQQQQQQQRAAQAYPKTPQASTVATPARSTATVTSLLNAVLTPTQSPVVSSAIAAKPTSGSQGSSNQYPTEERRPYGATTNGGTAGSTGAMQPLPATAAPANRTDNSSWMASPESDTRKDTTTTTPHDTKRADSWGASPPAANSTRVDSWPQPAVSSAKEDSWAQPAISGSSSTANSKYSSWGNTNQGKAVSDLVDWSTGLVSEFPTEAKPTVMAVTEPWDRMGKYDPTYVAGRQDTNSRQKTQQQQSQQSQQSQQPQKSQQQQPQPQRQQQLPPPKQLQQQPRRQQQQHSDSDDNEEDQHHRRECGNTQDKREVVEEQGGPDPWLNDGNAGLSDWGSSEPAESQMIFMDRDETSSQGQISHVSEPQVQQQHHRGAAHHRDDGEGHHPGTGTSQDRRQLTSEERFNNSFNRPPGGGSSSGGMSGGAANGRYGSRIGPGSRHGNGESGGGGSGGGHGYERAQRHGPTTVTPSSAGGLTGRRYFNNTMDRDSAIGAWSAASQIASKPGAVLSGSSLPLTGSGSAYKLATNATAGAQGSSSGKSPASGGRPALATASDFGSFFQAAAAFTPPPARARQGNRVRRGSESESTPTRLSSPSRSRESSRSRPSHSGAVLENTEEESAVGAEENVGHCSPAPSHEQAEVEYEKEEDLIKDDEDLIKDEEVVPVAVDTEEDKGEGQEVVEESERKATPRLNSNSSRSSSQAMEDNLLNFQMLKQPVASGSGVKEDEEEGEDRKREVVGGSDGASGGGEVDKVAAGSSQGIPNADSGHE
ncbi:hypothetical protein BGX24_008080 [Mortierella sp. AD032]|nr:hypothetical protein BGX24_008080 [Mortierella sp. AD032]